MVVSSKADQIAFQDRLSNFPVGKQLIPRVDIQKTQRRAVTKRIWNKAKKNVMTLGIHIQIKYIQKMNEYTWFRTSQISPNKI